MMRCRMTTCGTFTFEGKSRALPVTVTRCLRNIFRCRSARHWRGSVVMLNGDLWFNRGYRFNFCCDFSDDWRGRLSNNFRFSNHNLSSFGNFFNICRLFLRFNHRFCVFCDFLGYGNIRLGNHLRLFSYRGGNHFRMRRFNHFRLRFGNRYGASTTSATSSTTGALTTGSTAAATGTSVTIGCTCTSSLFALLFNLYILRTYNWIADPDFARGQFRRRARYGQRHWRLGWITLVTIATTTLTTHAQVTRRAARTTRHATVVTVISIVLFLLFWCSLRYDWQRDFHQFCAWSWSFLNNWFGSGSFFNHRCDYRFFGYALLVTHFLIELTLFTTRLNRTYTFFLFGFLNRLLFNIQRLRFLLRLTFIIVTAAATFTTRRLLLVGGTCFSVTSAC